MSENSAKNKRIAKNTLVLYMRMLVTMAVSLYTSRIVLEALGVEDYGIYNVIGGFVGMFTMLSGSLSSAISRFITFELGRGDQQRLNTVFSTSVIIQLVLSIIIVILIESVGVWFLTHKLVIPIERMYAAKWVLQLSVFSVVLGLISIPYNATIIAHEKMSAFAYITLLDVFWKLLIAYLLTRSSTDRLILYASLHCFISLVTRVIYGVYCKRKFEECNNFRWVFDWTLFKEMFGFAGWNFLGVSAETMKNQGVSMLLNVFFGPVVNAAQALSSQVINAVMSFSSNFMTALNPQITKSYASGDKEYMMTLIFQGIRLSIYLLLFLSLPIFLSTPYILSIWLVEIPDNTVLFIRLGLVYSIIESISRPLITAMLAYGKIRNYSLAIAIFSFWNLPISYVLLKLGFYPEIVVVVAIFISLCCLGTRLYMLRGMIGLSSIQFFKKVLINIFLVALVSLVLPYLLRINMENNLVGFLSVSTLCAISTLIAIYFIGCNKGEREFANSKINQFKERFI